MGSEFRIIIGPAKVLGNALARSTPTLGIFVLTMRLLFSTLLLALALGASTPVALTQESPTKPITDEDSLRTTVQRIEQLLRQHYRPMIPVANYRPLVSAKFEPVKFDSCTLKYRLVAVPTKGSSYILNVEMNLADLSSDDIDITRDLKRDDRWFVSFQTINVAPKIRTSYRHAIGSAVRTGSFMSPQNAFDADGRDTAQQIADLFVLAIQYCSEKH